MATALITIRKRRGGQIALAAFLLLAGCGLAGNPVKRVDALQSSGNLEPALKAAESALPRQNPQSRTYWELVLRKAQLLEALQRKEAAVRWLASVPISSHAPPDLAVLAIRERAAAERDLGQFSEAEQHVREALAIAVASGQTRMTTILQIRRAGVLIRLGLFDDAQQALAKAEAYVAKSNDHAFDPNILHYRGEALLAQNLFEDAIPIYSRALKLFRESNQPKAAARTMISEAWCDYRLGQTEKALSLYQEALRMAAADDRHLVLGHLGNIALDNRDYAQAAAYYRQAASGAKGRDAWYYPRWLHNLAQALIAQGKWAEAEPVNREALDLQRRSAQAPGLGLALINEARIEGNKGHYQAAEQILRRVAESRKGDWALAFQAYAELGELYRRTGKTEAVRPQFEAALALADENGARLREDEDKLSYLSSLVDVHSRYIDFLMDQGDATGAFLVAESSRARILRERLNLPRSRVPSYSAVKYQTAARQGRATFLAYWTGPKCSYLWAITGTRFASYALPAEAELRALVERYQSAVERGGAFQPGELTAGTKLFELLIPKQVRQPGGRYAIVPDGPLYALNFETLPQPGGGRFWIEDATVAITPALDVLLRKPTPPARGRSLLLVGDAAEWNPEYPKLLNARQEMESIGNLFPANQRLVLRGAEATPAAYERSNPAGYSLIHFTAHATANKNSPFDSAIILSRESQSRERTAASVEGKLSVKEVLATPVGAELVTISACHSAGARTYRGEGLVGFAWAFLQSGAHAVVAGLWDVSDYSSPRLMRHLYEGLAASESPAEALREAKLELLHSGKYAAPTYWGAFQLYEGAL